MFRGRLTVTRSHTRRAETFFSLVSIIYNWGIMVFRPWNSRKLSVKDIRKYKYFQFLVNIFQILARKPLKNKNVEHTNRGHVPLLNKASDFVRVCCGLPACIATAFHPLAAQSEWFKPFGHTKQDNYTVKKIMGLNLSPSLQHSLYAISFLLIQDKHYDSIPAQENIKHLSERRYRGRKKQIMCIQ